MVGAKTQGQALKNFKKGYFSTISPEKAQKTGGGRESQEELISAKQIVKPFDDYQDGLDQLRHNDLQKHS